MYRGGRAEVCLMHFLRISAAPLAYPPRYFVVSGFHRKGIYGNSSPFLNPFLSDGSSMNPSTLRRFAKSPEPSPASGVASNEPVLVSIFTCRKYVRSGLNE